ncbi:MAG: energy-coupling factor ABC transporter ATP-binding protein [Clostridia bacterium]|nr:energy-coupling factor ABC transporter ATP-binding protein [Clostridia bacterium]
MSHHRLDAKEVSFHYPDGNRAIDGVSLHITHGEAVGIVGANGAGKSTLLMLVMGLLQPQSGKVSVGDIEVTPKTIPLIRQHVGMVLQNPDDQLFMPTVYEDVAFGPRNMKLDENEVEKRVMEALTLVGIPHLKDRPPYRLSGGEKRAAAIASVMSMAPDLLIMDEPTTNLDPKGRRRIIELIKGFEHTRIITSHDMDMILELCPRTIVMKSGRIAADGETRSILTNEALLAECNLEMPLALQNCPVCGHPK